MNNKSWNKYKGERLQEVFDVYETMKGYKAFFEAE